MSKPQLVNKNTWYAKNERALPIFTLCVACIFAANRLYELKSNLFYGLSSLFQLELRFSTERGMTEFTTFSTNFRKF